MTGATLRATRKVITIVSTIVIGMTRRGTTASSTIHIVAETVALPRQAAANRDSLAA
jgi:hypothetical protein